MWLHLILLSVAFTGHHSVLPHVDAFSMPTRRTRMTMVNPGSIMGKIKNPFGGESESSKSPPPSSPNSIIRPLLLDPSGEMDEFDPSPEGLIARAKVIMATDLGIQNGNLLSDSFIWIGPFLDQPLSKVDYLAAGRFFDLRSAFPDLDYRAHDYRIDRVDPFTVRVTARTVGTMRGELRLRDQTLPPNGQQMRCPPEAISITFDPESGKIVKLCSGFTMDRLVGNTNGMCGVSAAATVAGEPPSDWEIYPALTVVQRFFGRPVPQIGESTSFLAPFPETVMVQLAKGILSSNMAADDPSLLSSGFTYITPTLGAVGKKVFLEKFAAEEFAGIEPEFSHFRVDPYDPNRVWVDVRPLGPGFEGPPQAMSFTFDDDGFCKRVTSGAVMDPSLGNAGGLGGPEGLKYSAGTASPAILTRPLPRVLGRLQKKILAPITGVGVDDYTLPDYSAALPRTQDTPESPVVETLSTLKAERTAVEQSAPPQPPTPAADKPSRPPPPSSPTKIQAPKMDAPKVPVPKVPTFSMPMPTSSSSSSTTKQQQQVPSKKPASKKTAKPSTKDSAPTFSIPKLPTLSLSAPQQQPKKPTPSKTPAPKVSSPTLSIKLPTFSISPPTTKPTSTAAQAKTAQKLAEQKRAAAVKKEQENARRQREAQKAEQDRKKAEMKKRQEEAAKQKQLQQAKIEAEAKRKAEEERAQQLKAEKERLAKQAEEQKQQVEARKAEAEKKRLEAEAQRKAAEEERRQQLANQAEERKQQVEARKAEDEEKKRLETEAKRKAVEEGIRAAEEARRAAEVTKRQQLKAEQEARRAAEEARRQEIKAEQEARRAAEEARRQQLKAEQDRKQAEMKKLAEDRRQQEEAKKAEAERKRKEQETKKQAAAKEAERKRIEALKQKAAAATAEKAKPGATINLFGLMGGNPTPAAQAETKSVAPKPRPTINLFSAPSPTPQQKATEAAKKAKPGATITLFGLGGGGDDTPQRAAKAVETAKKATPGATINLFGLGGGESKENIKPASQAKRQTKSVERVEAARPGATINLFGLGSSPAETKKSNNAKPTPKPTPTVAPRGVPTISGWRKNGDSSITGSISGSPNFASGERVTTSPIVQGEIKPGKLVRTASGSRYFLK